MNILAPLFLYCVCLIGWSKMLTCVICCRIALLRGCTTLYSHQQYKSISFFLYPNQYWALRVLLLIAQSKKWYLIILIYFIIRKVGHLYHPCVFL